MTRSQSESTCELRGFIDLNFARRPEMAETATRDQVSGFERYWPDATPEVIAGGTAIFSGQTYPANHIVGMVCMVP